MIDDGDFFPVKAKSKYKCYTRGCKNKSKDMQFYLTEWTIHGGNSTNGVVYCEDCILKAFPNLKVNTMCAYKPVTSLVNGEIIKDLLDLCNSWFLDPFVYESSIDVLKCRYCAADKKADGTTNHGQDCPFSTYMKIVEQHKRFIVKS